jgi:hypothetical protein
MQEEILKKYPDLAEEYLITLCDNCRFYEEGYFAHDWKCKYELIPVDSEGNPCTYFTPTGAPDAGEPSPRVSSSLAPPDKSHAGTGGAGISFLETSNLKADTRNYKHALKLGIYALKRCKQEHDFEVIAIDGHAITFPPGDGVIEHVCCDCGLTHRIDYHPLKKGGFTLTFNRDEKKTMKNRG